MNTFDLFVSSNLPSRLSEEEMMLYFNNYKLGDLKSRDIIINHNIRLVLNQVLKKFGSTQYDKKELVSIGLVGLINAVDTYDANRNIKFVTYAITCINNEILNFIKKEKKHINDVSLESPLNTSDNIDELKLEDTIPDININIVSMYEFRETNNIVDEIVNNLPADYKLIVMLYFGFNTKKPLTLQEIGDILGMSKYGVSKKLNKILNIIKDEIEKNNIIDNQSDKTLVKRRLSNR